MTLRETLADLELSSTSKLLYMLMSRTERGKAFKPMRVNLTDYGVAIGASRSTVRRSLAQLADKGLLLYEPGVNREGAVIVTLRRQHQREMPEGITPLRPR